MTDHRTRMSTAVRHRLQALAELLTAVVARLRWAGVVVVLLAVAGESLVAVPASGGPEADQPAGSVSVDHAVGGASIRAGPLGFPARAPATPAQRMSPIQREPPTPQMPPPVQREPPTQGVPPVQRAQPTQRARPAPSASPAAPAAASTRGAGSETGSPAPPSGAGVPASGAGVPASGAGVPVPGAGVPASGAGVPASGAGVPASGAGVPVPGTGVPAPGAGYAWPLHPAPLVLSPFRAPDHAYGPGHRGADLAGAIGQAVVAARAGVVVFAGPVAGRGAVSVEHDDGLRTTYEPVRPTVRAGSAVAAGAVLGSLEAGHRGCPQACLHWGVRRDRLEYLDPLVLLRPTRVRLLPVPLR